MFRRIWNLPFLKEEEKILFAVILKTSRNTDFYLEIVLKEKANNQTLQFNIKKASEPEIESAATYEFVEEGGLSPEEMMTFDLVQQQVAPGKKGLEETYNFFRLEVSAAISFCEDAMKKDLSLEEQVTSPLRFLEVLQEELENLHDAFLEAREQE